MRYDEARCHVGELETKKLQPSCRSRQEGTVCPILMISNRNSWLWAIGYQAITLYDDISNRQQSGVWLEAEAETVKQVQNQKAIRIYLTHTVVVARISSSYIYHTWQMG